MESLNDYQKHILELLDDDVDFDTIVDELYSEESNYNNADPSSGQIVLEKTDIQSEVEAVLFWARDQDDRCSECGRLIEDGNYISERNLCVNDPYPIYENIAVGYTCSCGNREKW